MLGDHDCFLHDSSYLLYQTQRAVRKVGQLTDLCPAFQIAGFFSPCTRYAETYRTKRARGREKWCRMGPKIAAQVASCSSVFATPLARLYELRSNRSAIAIPHSDYSPLSLLLQKVGLDESFPSILGAVSSPVEHDVLSGVRRREQNVWLHAKQEVRSKLGRQPKCLFRESI